MNRRIIVGVLAGLMVPYLTTLAWTGARFTGRSCATSSVGGRSGGKTADSAG